MGEEELLEDLHEKAMRIYLLLVSSRRPLTVREIQKRLNFSSPSLVHYHLRKLEAKGLLEHGPEGYRVKKIVKAGVLRAFAFLGHYIVPKSIFCSAFFLGLLLMCVLFFWGTKEIGLFLLATVGLGLASLSWLLHALFAWRDLLRRRLR